MKFAKRLASEASRKVAFSASYFDYRGAKKAIKDDIAKSDVAGSSFQQLLEAELRKVSQFYSEAADRIEASLKVLHKSHGSAASVQQLKALRSEIKELIKFVALNYLAVVKAIKKRNRHLKETFGAAASISLQALDMLGHEVFFTSPRLANLATQADVLVSGLGLAGAASAASGGGGSSTGGASGSAAAASGGGGTGSSLQQQQQPGDVLEEYQCPICLDTLHNPVVLTCAHRFCWGCLVAHVTAVRNQQLPLAPGDQDGKGSGSDLSSLTHSLRLLERIAAQDDTCPDQQRFYNCPVCRKPQVLDVDSLSVDPFLSSFIESLKVLSVSGSPATTTATTAISSEAKEAAAAAAAVASKANTCTAAVSQLLLQPQPHPQQEHKQQQAEPAAWGLLPPQRPEHVGRLCVLLDLDGTLVSSYTPRRAPRLPPYVRTHLVGVGSKLNPAGVFVVERPGLQEFLQELASFAEVVIYTAGLEDYAKPIIDAIDPAGALFAHRLYREATLRTDHYQCVKDMGRLGRDLRRTLLVDDTPLAFLHQPDNGVPVLGFRGDPDDRLLLEAVLPLMQVLAKETDVRHVLQRRFDMTPWFRRNSLPIDTIVAEAAEAAEMERAAAAQHQQQHHHHQHHAGPSHRTPLASAPACVHTAPSTPCKPATPSCSSTVTAASSANSGSCRSSCDGLHPGGCNSRPRYSFTGPRLPVPLKRFVVLTDFDRTLTDCDAGEAVVEQLAPELLPMLVGLDPSQSYIPITNTILSEIQRRGVSRDQLLMTLQQLGAEMPLASAELLRMMHGAGIDVRILSDCNSVFIGHILAGATVAGYVTDVVTNPAAFERVAEDVSPAAGSVATVTHGSSQQAAALQRVAGHRLVILPHYTGQDQHVVLPAPPPPTTTHGSVPSCGGAACCKAAQHSHSTAAASAATLRPHGCSRCPDNMCKGLEVQRLQHRNTYGHVIYCGDGSNDVCAALALRPTDVLLARSGHPLARYVQESQSNRALPRVEAQVAYWSTHEELLSCVRQIVDV